MDLKLAAMIATGSVLAAASGYGASLALGQEGDPARTVTINVGGTGEQGPPGEPGPPGPPGATGPAGGVTCPAGSTWSAVEFVQPGEGPTTLLACVKD